MAGGGILHAFTQIANHTGYLNDFWQDILIPIALTMIFAPVVYVVRYSLNHPLIITLVFLGLGSKLVHLFLDFADDAPGLNQYPIFDNSNPKHIFLQETFGAASIALLLSAMYYFIVSFQRSQWELSKDKEALKKEIQDRLKIEQDLRNAKLTAELANRAKSEFMARISHEIRTPMTSIIGYAQVLHAEKVGPINRSQKECLETIQRNSQHLLEVIDEILDLSSIEADKCPLALSTFDLEKTLRHCFDLVKTQVTGKGLGFSFETVPIGRIWADEKKIRHVVLNLLSNACKFTDIGGRIGIVVDKTEEEVLITVWDTGIGIDPFHHERVFEDFYQIEQTEHRNHSGTGIGLSICKKFVELHEGRIWVESRPNRGSRFSFTIPQPKNEDDVPIVQDQVPTLVHLDEVKN